MIIHVSFDNAILNYLYYYLEPELLYLTAAVFSFYHFYYKKISRTAHQLPLPRQNYKNRLNFFEWFVSVYFISLGYITFKNNYAPVFNDYFKDILEQKGSTDVTLRPPLGWVSFIIVGVYLFNAWLRKNRKPPTTPENNNHRPGNDNHRPGNNNRRPENNNRRPGNNNRRPENNNRRPGNDPDSDSDSDIIDYHAYIYEFLQRNTRRNGPATATRRNDPANATITYPTAPESLAAEFILPSATPTRSVSTQTDFPLLQVEPAPIQTQSTSTQTPLQIEAAPIQIQSSSTQTDSPLIQPDSPSTQPDSPSTQTDSPPLQPEPPFYEHLTDDYQRGMASIFTAPPATTTVTENVQRVAGLLPASEQRTKNELSFDSILEILVNAADILNGAIDNLRRNNNAISFDLVLQTLVQSTIVLNRSVKLVMNPFSRPTYSTPPHDVQSASTSAPEPTIPLVSEVDSDDNGAQDATITDTTTSDAAVEVTTDNTAVEVTTNDTAVEATTNTSAVEVTTDNTAVETTTDNTAVEATTDNTAVEVTTDNTAVEANTDTSADTTTNDTATNTEVVATQDTPSRPESSQSTHSNNSSSSSSNHSSNSTHSNQSNHSNNSTQSNQSNQSNHSNHSNHSGSPPNAEDPNFDIDEYVANLELLTSDVTESPTESTTESTTENDGNTEPKKDKGKRPYNSSNNTATVGVAQEEIDYLSLVDAETSTQQQRTDNPSAFVRKYTPEDWEAIKLERMMEFNLDNRPTTNNSKKWLTETDFSVGISTGWERSSMSISTDTPVSALSSSSTDTFVPLRDLPEPDFSTRPRLHAALRSRALARSRAAASSSNLSASRSTSPIVSTDSPRYRPTTVTDLSRTRSTTPSRTRTSTPSRVRTPTLTRSRSTTPTRIRTPTPTRVLSTTRIRSRSTTPTRSRSTTPTRIRTPAPPIRVSEEEPEFLIPISHDISPVAASSSAHFGSINYTTPLTPEPVVPTSSQPTLDWSDPISPKSSDDNDDWITESLYGAQEQAKDSSSDTTTQQASSSQQQQTQDNSSTGATSEWANFANSYSTETNTTGTVEQSNSWTTVEPRQRKGGLSSRGGPSKKKKVTFKLETTGAISQTRCRRWPYCNESRHCNFTHPQTDCMNGNSCKYQHRCGFLHHPRDDRNYQIWLNRKKT